MVGAIVGKEKKGKAAQEEVEDSGKLVANLIALFGEPTSAKLFRQHARKLAELGREEDLEGGSAEAFAKHFGPLLDNLLIAAKAARLQRLRDEQKK